MFKKPSTTRFTDQIKSGSARVGSVARDMAGNPGEAFAGLRTMFSGDDAATFGVENFMLALVAAVRNENVEELRSEKDVRKAASRRRRKLAMASFVTGPFAGFTLQITDLYCDAAMVGEVAASRGLRLSDREIASQLLLLWSITDSVDDALRAMQVDDERRVMALLSERLRDQYGGVMPEKLNKRGIVKLLWRSRGMTSWARNFTMGSAMAAAVRPGKDVKEVIAVIQRNLDRAAASPAARPAIAAASVADPSRVLGPSVTGVLTECGAAVVDARRAGRPMSDPRFGWERFTGPVSQALAGPERGTALDELAAASAGNGLATLGAYWVIAEFDPHLGDPRYLALYDAALEFLRSLGFSSGHLTRNEADRWIRVHGELRSSFDGMVEVAVPSTGLPGAKPLAPGETRLIALTEPLPEGNAFYAECRADGRYAVYSERQRSSDDPTRGRYEESQLGTFGALEPLLRAVGEMFGSRPYWADDDLEPYFPRRRGA